MRLHATTAALALAATIGASPAASAADFWLQGRYSAWIVKRSCDAYGGQYHMQGGLRYRCELADGKAVDCSENHECRAHDPSSSSLPPSPRTLLGFLAAAAPASPHPGSEPRIERKP